MNAPAETPPAWIETYRRLLAGTAWHELPRTQIELTGADRASFLHNLCTNEVRRLAPGTGREAFFTTVQGKTLGHGLIYVGDESLVLDTVEEQNERLLKHLDHYLVCEQVELHDRSARWGELLVSGAAIERVEHLAETALAAEPLANARCQLAGVPVWLRRASLISSTDLLISACIESLPTVCAKLAEAGWQPSGRKAFEAARIEWGFPWYGVDLTDANLPQELARDAQAISFVKGCYLGQETVARIDALGHVNKSLVGVGLDSMAPPAAGSEITQEGQTVGHVTSATYSPRLAAALALAYVRRGNNVPGQELTVGGVEAKVVALPVRC